MRNLLLATAAVAIVAMPALASGPYNKVDFNISSSLAKECSIGAESTNLVVGPSASEGATGEFATTCNFEISELTLTFTSAKGGVLNEVEGITELYNITFDGETFGSDVAADGVVLARSSGPVANNPVARTFEVALQQDLSIAGEYADVLTIEVAP
jgi:hypothetical protein